MKLKFVLFILLVALYSFRIWQTMGCKNFIELYFNPLSIKINVESSVNIDQEVSRNISRFFHNKLITGLYESSKSYVATFEPKVLVEILGPLGLVLILMSLTRLVFERKIPIIVSFAAVTLFSLIAIISTNSKMPIYALAISWYNFSFWGLKNFNNPRRKLVFVGLVILTFWYFSLNWQMPALCNEIFFN